MANDRGEFWENLVRQVRPVYENKGSFMRMVHIWFEEPDIGLASIAWDLLSLERGEDNL